MKTINWKLSLEEFATIQMAVYEMADILSQKVVDTADPRSKEFYQQRLNVIRILLSKQFKGG